MYFPYLRGRQFELIALRELVESSLLSNKIIPIIEPVKLSSTLIKTIEIFQGADKQLALVRNPQVGNFVSDLNKDKNVHLKEKLYRLIKLGGIVDVHFLNPHSEKFINRLLEGGKDISDIITICKNEDDIPIFEEFFSSGKPKYNLISDESVFRRRIRHNRVMMDNRFKKQSRNTDYAKMDDEPFSTDHLYYDEDGYVGFSDYSIIGNEYNETGFAPYAVAIHIVYFDKDNRLRIKHFVSDTNDDITDPAGKFAEAVGKLVEWNKTKKLDTFSINTLTQMHEKEIYPGLGTVKKLSLMHHIELIGRFLDGEIKK
ncbi:MAG: sce7725 family protein [Bacillota bacterium]